MPPPPAATFPAGSGLQTQPDLTIAYALPPNQPSGYLVHGEVAGEYRKSCTRKKSSVILSYCLPANQLLQELSGVCDRPVG
jgi:hypothetical protein